MRVDVLIHCLDVPGTVCSIATINMREKDGQGPWKIAVAYRTSDDKPVATKLIQFEVTMDVLNGENIIGMVIIIIIIIIIIIMMVIVV